MSKKAPPKDPVPTRRSGPQYSCPMCKSERYKVLAKALYQCSGCTFSFTDPARFEVDNKPGDDRK
jgi:ribosomal protein L37AE/L43A